MTEKDLSELESHSHSVKICTIWLTFFRSNKCIKTLAEQKKRRMKKE
jgi:hypothetical protein